MTALDDHRVDRDIALAETLPASAFTDPAFLERELGTLFARSWLLAPPADGGETRSLGELLAAPDSHAPVTLAGKPLLLRRDSAGTLALSDPAACDCMSKSTTRCVVL